MFTVLSMPTVESAKRPIPETPSDSPEISPIKLPIPTVALVFPSNVLSSAVAPVMLIAFGVILAVMFDKLATL